MCGGSAVRSHGRSGSAGVPDAVLDLARLRATQSRAPHHIPARYVMLFGADREPRAALFDAELRFMTEMIEFDRLAMDRLLGGTMACPPPSSSMLDAVARLAPRASLSPVRCFKLN